MGERNCDPPDRVMPSLHKLFSYALAAAVMVGLLSWSATASAFEYIEHTYFSDRACLEAQRRLGAHLDETGGDKGDVARYLALALTCPRSWEQPYCRDGDKQLQAGINPLTAPPPDSGELAVTLGEFSALVDHLSKFGPIAGLGRIGPMGLTYETWSWLTGEPGDAGGVIGRVAHQGCRHGDYVPWERVEHDISSFMKRVDARGEFEEVPPGLLSPVVREPIPAGPSDPSGTYSFINPHYLDLVLRNHSHFGEHAYSAWLGFHSAAVSVSGRSCEEILAFDAAQLGRLASRVDGFERLDWEAMDEDAQARSGCAMLRTATRQRLVHWAEQADPELVDPVRQTVETLAGADDRAPVQLDDVVVALTSLVMEGAGLHYLQDGLASGHMRTIRSKEQLSEVRYDHDADNREGLVALLQTRSGGYPFVAFGDTYLLGPVQFSVPVDCDWSTLAQSEPSKALVSSCLIQHQRGILVATSAASLVDWGLGGTLYDAAPDKVSQQPAACERDNPLEAFVCRALPVRPTRVAGEDSASGWVLERMPHGSIPVPPPMFGYESLSFGIGLEATGDATQLGLHLTLLSELDDRANWLTSHRMGLRSTYGQANLNQFMLDYAYGFHWRWSARFLVDARGEIFTGLRGLDDDVAFFTGVAPHFSLTILPEGWTKLPVELSLGYRFPMVFYGSDAGFFGEGFVGGHWVLLGLGLAFM
jgi:hypothetical protein